MKKLSRLLVLPALLLSIPSWALFEDLLGSFSTELEERSALSALETYRRLILEEGCTDNLAIDPGDIIGGDQPDGFGCTGRTFRIFRNVREVIHTGNDLTGSGPTSFSLRSSLEGLGFALRWLAAEEYAAQGDLSSDFVGGQVSGLSSRLSALRFGARGFQFSNNGVWQPKDGEYAGIYGTSGGSAGEDNYSKWGGFANINYGAGSRDPTGLENAFDAELVNLTFGVDYRANSKWIVGLVGGIIQQEIDFDASQSIVEGGIESDGFSLMPFFMYQPGAFYLSGSLGVQQLTFDSVRAIRYPSFNPSISSTNTETVSSTDAQISSLFLEAGYNWSWRKYSVEPFLSINASNVVIDEFVEDDINDDAFDLVVKEQDFDLIDATLGVKVQYVFTPKFGVFIPYLTLELVNQTENESRDIEAYYAGLSSTDSLFFVPTEELDSSYSAYTFGLSSVIRGGREKKAGGSVGGDLQAFANIKTLSGLEGYDLQMYTLGFRYTF
jgi:uncharacterized protein YhjY with autotransporter beta-barrel domain